MHSFVYYSPTKVVFGKDTQRQVAQLAREFGASRVMIVYGSGSVVRSGLLAEIEAIMAQDGLPCCTLGGVQPNPRTALAREGAKKAIEFGADFILAAGGGSVIDTAKAIAHGAATPEVDLWEYWKGTKTVERSLPVGVVLTISAAGSETSDSAVLTDEESGTKRGINTPFNRPRFAIMNPELTYTLPRYQVACGVVDIMMHTMDRYFNPVKGNDLTDAFAEALLRTVMRYGVTAVNNPHDEQAMSELMWCGSVSHNGLTGLGGLMDFCPHKLGHELSGRFDVAHGASLSVMWGAWATYSRSEHPERFAQFAKEVLGITETDVDRAGKMAIEEVVNYFRKLEMPTSFTELGIGVQPEEVLQDMAMRATRGDTIQLGSFRPLNAQRALEVYRLANH